MKNTLERKRKPKKRKQSKNIALRMVGDFLRFNGICLMVLVVAYIIMYLFLLQWPDLYTEVISKFLIDTFGKGFERFIFSRSYLMIIPAFLCMFVFNCFLYSIITLSLFNKTYQSLDAISKESAEFMSFPKSYSDVEIRLRDLRLDVVGSRQAAAEAESRKNDLVMYLAHDLKTPLTSVIGYLTLLDECPELTTEQKAKYVDIALDKAYRLEQLINEFFEITRFDINSVTLEKNRIDLNMMIAQITDEFYPMLSEKNLTVDIDIIEHIVMFADSDKIARVFDNLLKNAVNYSYENTKIRIGARIRRDKVIIKFRNKSDVISPEKLQRLFEKFYRADSSRGTSTGGSGLGLAIAKQITELHGGTIKAKSTTDYTDFTVVLPYINAEDLTDEQLDF